MVRHSPVGTRRPLHALLRICRGFVALGGQIGHFAHHRTMSQRIIAEPVELPQFNGSDAPAGVAKRQDSLLEIRPTDMPGSKRSYTCI